MGTGGADMSPLVSMLTFTTIGRPSKALGFPAAYLASDSLAAARAPAAQISTLACNSSLVALILAKQASTS
jgi:hypothetical protein